MSEARSDDSRTRLSRAMGMARDSDIQQARQKLVLELDLEKYVLELDLNGYTVVPPEVNGVSSAQIDELSQLLLDKSEELVGCKFTLEDGPECPLDFGEYRGTLELQSGAKPSQFQLMQLCTLQAMSRST